MTHYDFPVSAAVDPASLHNSLAGAGLPVASVMALPFVARIVTARELSAEEQATAATIVANYVPPAIVLAAEFRRRIMPAYLALGSALTATQEKWDRILRALDSFYVVNLGDPVVIGMVQIAVADGLLTDEQAAAVLASPATPPVEPPPAGGGE